MTWVDASRLVKEATAEQQAARPKMSVIRIANGDGTYSYYQQFYLAAPVTVSGPVELTVGGVTPDTDETFDALGESHTQQVVKLMLGDVGVSGGLVSENNPIPTVDQDIRGLLLEMACHLKAIRLLLEGLA